MRPLPRDSGVLLFTCVLAFLSGMCALVYEIVWTRAFTPIFGLTLYTPEYVDRGEENVARSLEQTLGDLPDALRREVESVAQRGLRGP